MGKWPQNFDFYTAFAFTLMVQSHGLELAWFVLGLDLGIYSLINVTGSNTERS